MARKSTSKTSSGGSNRFRNWVTVVYPESAPPNWKAILEDEIVPAFISPLHDMDVNPTGEVKKAHYHVMVMFEGVKTKEQVKEIFDKIGGVGIETVNSLRGYARYLCHLDNPDKAQYNPADVYCLGGADYSNIISLATDRYAAVRDMMIFCDENRICSFSQLMCYARDHRYDWFRLLCDSSAYVMKEYIKSSHWEYITYGKSKQAIPPDGMKKSPDQEPETLEQDFNS